MINEALVDENAMLVFPAYEKEVVWKDADGKIYVAGDLVTSDLSLYAEVEDAENEEVKGISILLATVILLKYVILYSVYLFLRTIIWQKQIIKIINL